MTKNIERRGEPDLEPVDPVDGALLQPLPPPVRFHRRRSLAWALGLLLLVATGASVYVVVGYRAAHRLNRSWAEASRDVEDLRLSADELFRVQGVARLAGEDVDITAARRATGPITVSRLQQAAVDIRAIRAFDATTRNVQRDVLTIIENWTRDAESFASGSPFFDPDVDPTTGVKVRALARRWRVQDQTPRRPRLLDAAAQVVYRLSRVVDHPIPASLTVLTPTGERVDLDLRTGVTTTNDVAFGGAVPVRLWRSGDRLLGRSSTGLVSLPVDPSRDVTRMDHWYTIPSSTSATWTVEIYPNGSVARAVTGNTPPVSLPRGWDAVGATDSELVLLQFHDDRPATFATMGLASGRLRELGPGDRLIATGAKAFAWLAADRASIAVTSADGSEALAIPNGWEAPEGGLVLTDGTLVVPLRRAESDGAHIGLWVKRPGEGSLSLLWQAQGSEAVVSCESGWCFSSIRGYGSSVGVRAHELATGRSAAIRLTAPATSFVAHP